MNLNIKVKPQLIKGDTKQQVLNTLRGQYGTTYSTIGKSVVRVHRDRVVLVNFEKHRRKTKQNRVKNITKSTIVKKAHWKAFVYIIDKSILNYVNINQDVRNFEITNLK